MCLKLGSKH